MTPKRTISGILVIRIRFLRAMTRESRTDWPRGLVGAAARAASVVALTWRSPSWPCGRRPCPRGRRRPRGRSPFTSATWPVRERKTSSRVGRRRPMSSISIPRVSSSRMTSASSLAPPVTGTVSLRVCSSTVVEPLPNPPSTSAAVAMCSRSWTTTSTRSPPVRALSWSEVPRAMTRPWSTTAMSCARWSRLLQVLRGQQQGRPAGDQLFDDLHSSWRLRGSRPVVGSSMNMTGGETTRAAARSSRRRMPPE